MKHRKKTTLLMLCSLLVISWVVSSNSTKLKFYARSFLQGSWYLEAHRDTLYAIGVYGIKQYQIEEEGRLKLLNENRKACEEGLTCRGCAVGTDYLYVTVRRRSPGTAGFGDANTTLGEILVVDKDDLNVINRIRTSQRKQIECQLVDNRLIVEGINGFEIYDLTDSARPVCIFSTDGQGIEFQGGCTFHHDDLVYACFPHWEFGLSIWDVSASDSIHRIAVLPRDSIMLTDGTRLAHTTQQFHAIADYPFIFTTLGPANSHAGLQPGTRNKGILVYDVSRLDSIRVTAAYVPEADWYTRPTGDMQPTYLAKYGNKIYTNFSNRGVALFDVSNPMEPRHEGTCAINFRQNPLSLVTDCKVQPICVTPDGWLFAGDYNTPHIYPLKLEK